MLDFYGDEGDDYEKKVERCYEEFDEEEESKKVKPEDSSGLSDVETVQNDEDNSMMNAELNVSPDDEEILNLEEEMLIQHTLRISLISN